MRTLSLSFFFLFTVAASALAAPVANPVIVPLSAGDTNHDGKIDGAEAASYIEAHHDAGDVVLAGLNRYQPDAYTATGGTIEGMAKLFRACSVSKLGEVAEAGDYYVAGAQSVDGKQQLRINDDRTWYLGPDTLVLAHPAYGPLTKANCVNPLRSARNAVPDKKREEPPPPLPPQPPPYQVAGRVDLVHSGTVNHQFSGAVDHRHSGEVNWGAIRVVPEGTTYRGRQAQSYCAEPREEPRVVYVQAPQQKTGFWKRWWAHRLGSALDSGVYHVAAHELNPYPDLDVAFNPTIEVVVEDGDNGGGPGPFPDK